MEVLFAKRLKELRRSAGLTQRELADALGVSQQTVWKWETGGATPNPQSLADLSVIFGTSVDYLVGFRSEEEEKARVQFALFGGRVDDRTYEEVIKFAKFTKEKNQE